MHNDCYAETLRMVVGRVLEDASFVFTDEISPDERPAADNWDAVGISVAFSGERSGSFRFWADRPFARLLAANMLGMEMDGPAAEQKGADALKEMANIIAGNSLTELFGETAVYDLGIPATTDESLKAADCGRVDAIWLGAEEHKLLCVVEVR